MYLTYEEYQNMGGTLDETAFNDFEFEAECIINWFTFDRLKNETEYPENVKRCMQALIRIAKMKSDALSLGEQTTTTESGVVVNTQPSIASQSNDGVSISYNTVSAAQVFDLLSARKPGGEVESMVQMYLQGVVNSLGHKVLYRGIYENE